MNHDPKELNWESVERLDWHLWVLSILLIFVLGVSLLGFMFPTAFWFGQESQMESPQRAFVGFCVLFALVLVYLLQRQATVRRLKRQLFQAQTAVMDAEREATLRAFLDLPGANQFRDALAMAYRRASASSSHLAEVIFKVPGSSQESTARLVRLLRPMLRRGEGLYRISDKAVAMILPGMDLSNAAALTTQAEELGGFTRGEIEISITAFPEEVSSLAELEARLRTA